MAKAKGWTTFTYRKGKNEKRTSIGKSNNSRPKNKHRKKSWKKYRGQGT